MIQRQLLPSHSPEIPFRPSRGVPSERLRLVKGLISHRLHTGAWLNLVLLTYLRTTCSSIIHLRVRIKPASQGWSNFSIWIVFSFSTKKCKISKWLNVRLLFSCYLYKPDPSHILEGFDHCVVKLPPPQFPCLVAETSCGGMALKA